jgi:AraC family transcriptional activator of tynA and feaB
MEQIHWDGTKLCASPGHRNINDQILRFVSRHIYTCRSEKGIPDWSASGIHGRNRSVESFGITRLFSAAPGVLRRNATDIAADHRDHYALMLEKRGVVEVSQFGRSQRLSPGGYTFISASEPIVHRGPGGGDTICFMMPAAYVDAQVVSGEHICLRTSDIGKGLPKLVFETIDAMENNAADLNDAEFEKSAHVVADLVLLALRGSVDLVSGEHSVRAANLARAKRIMRRWLSNCDLTPADIARQSGFSVRYLYNLFRDEERTVCEYLLSERLHRAWELLVLSSSRNLTITDVSLECGFSGVTNFGRSFKRAFGISPKEARGLSSKRLHHPSG